MVGTVVGTAFDLAFYGLAFFHVLIAPFDFFKSYFLQASVQL